MINVLSLKNKILDEITYFVTNNSSALIIDPGSDFERIYQFVLDNKWNVLGVLITHGHFDHIYSCKKLQKVDLPVPFSRLTRTRTGKRLIGCI